MNREFTGRHMATILVVGFGIVIAVNLTMARFAITTFGGVVVENSYVASQHFNRWLDEAEQVKALGWTVGIERDGGNHVHVLTKGVPADATVSATARHPLGRLPDQALTFAAVQNGDFVSKMSLPPGRWILRVEIQAGEHVWRSEKELR